MNSPPIIIAKDPGGKRSPNGFQKREIDENVCPNESFKPKMK